MMILGVLSLMTRRRRNKKWIWKIIFPILLIIAGIVCFLVWDNYFNDKKSDGKEIQEQTAEEERQLKKEMAEKKKDDDDEDEDERKTVQYEGDDPNLKEELSGSVTYAGKIDNKIIIRLNIDQYLNEGKCELRLINKDINVYNDTVNVISSASTATCEGFDIPASDIGSGNYDIVINITSNGREGVIRGEIDV